MKLFAPIKGWRKKRDLQYAQDKLEGKPSPFREGAPEKAQSNVGSPNEIRYIP